MTTSARRALFAHHKRSLHVFDLPQLPEAACRGHDPDLFFPDKGGRALAAKAICRSCPVLAECLRDALDRNEKYGVWGGLTAEEREPLSPSADLAQPIDPDDARCHSCGQPMITERQWRTHPTLRRGYRCAAGAAHGVCRSCYRAARRTA